MDRIDPTLPMLRMDPALPMESIEPALPMLSTDAALNKLAKLNKLYAPRALPMLDRLRQLGSASLRRSRRPMAASKAITTSSL